MTDNSGKPIDDFNNFEDVERMERERPWEKDYTPPENEIYQNIDGFLIPPGVNMEEIRAAREAEEAAACAAAAETTEAAAPVVEKKPAPVAAPKRPAAQVMKPHQVRGPDETPQAKQAAKPKEDAVSRRYNIDDVDDFEQMIMGAPDRDFIKPGFAVGNVGSRIAMGGVGKTWFSLQEAVAIATGSIFCGHQYKRGAVIYLSAEEQRPEIRARAKSIFDNLGMDREMVAMGKQNLKCWYLFGTGPNLLEFVDDTYLFEEGLTRLIKKYQPFYEGDKLRLIVFDTLRRFSQAEENSTNEMTNVLTRIESIAKKFDCACIFLHHMNKASSIRGEAFIQQSARGASVLTDNIRYQEYLQVMSKDMANKLGIVENGRVSNPIGEEYQRFIEWGVAKQNSGCTVKPIWLERRMDGTLKTCKIGKYDANAVSTTQSQSYPQNKVNKGEFGVS